MLFIFGMYALSALVVVCLFKRKVLEYKRHSSLAQYLFITCLALFPVGNSVICAYVLYRLAKRRRRQLQHG
jgi:hypothetical protein